MGTHNLAIHTNHCRHSALVLHVDFLLRTPALTLDHQRSPSSMVSYSASMTGPPELKSGARFGGFAPGLPAEAGWLPSEGAEGVAVHLLLVPLLLCCLLLHALRLLNLK